eukprot:11104713-Alexandrium_andersonii.AAC.1
MHERGNSNQVKFRRRAGEGQTPRKRIGEKAEAAELRLSSAPAETTHKRRPDFKPMRLPKRKAENFSQGSFADAGNDRGEPHEDAKLQPLKISARAVRDRKTADPRTAKHGRVRPRLPAQARTENTANAKLKPREFRPLQSRRPRANPKNQARAKAGTAPKTQLRNFSQRNIDAFRRHRAGRETSGRRPVD